MLSLNTASCGLGGQCLHPLILKLFTSLITEYIEMKLSVGSRQTSNVVVHEPASEPIGLQMPVSAPITVRSGPSADSTVVKLYNDAMHRWTDHASMHAWWHMHIYIYIYIYIYYITVHKSILWRPLWASWRNSGVFDGDRYFIIMQPSGFFV